MVKQITIPARQCTCDVCGHIWINIEQRLPDRCAEIECRSRAWNRGGGVGTPGRPKRPRNTVNLALPKPHRPRHV